MATFNFDGNVIAINDKSVTSKANGTVYNSKEIIVNTVNEQYEQTYKIEVREKQYDKIQNLTVGTVATFHTNVNGRKWEKPDGTIDAFVTLSLWKYEQAGGASTPPAYTQAPPVPNFDSGSNTDDGDLPF